jgi:hypothetical protein
MICVRRVLNKDINMSAEIEEKHELILITFRSRP